MNMQSKQTAKHTADTNKQELWDRKRDIEREERKREFEFNRKRKIETVSGEVEPAVWSEPAIDTHTHAYI